MPTRDRSITVSELNLKARRLLEQGMDELWVSGELSRVTLHTSGHWYFTLKDARIGGLAMGMRTGNGGNASIQVPSKGHLLRSRLGMDVHKNVFIVCQFAF